MRKDWQNLGVFIFCLVICGMLSSVVLGFFGIGNIDGGNGVSTANYIIAATVTQLIMFLGSAMLYFKVIGQPFMASLSIKRISNKELLLVSIYFGIAFAVVLALSPLSTFVDKQFPNHIWIQYQHQVTAIQNSVIGDLRGIKIIIGLLVFAVLPAFCEEIVFRGILYRRFKAILGSKYWAMFMSATVFSIFHFQILSFIPILIVGLLLAHLYERTNNLSTSMLVHFGFNAVQILFWQA